MSDWQYGGRYSRSPNRTRLSKAQEKALRLIRSYPIYSYEMKPYGISERTLESLRKRGLVEVCMSGRLQ